MSFILNALRKPGAMREVVAAAPTQRKAVIEDDAPAPDQGTGYTVKTKSRALDRGLDHIVRFSGSTPAFIVIQTLLVGWAILGIPFGSTSIWPIIISDTQAIFSYIFDSLLMRQQLNGYYEGLDVAGELKSRNDSKARMLDMVAVKLGPGLKTVVDAVQLREVEERQLPEESWFGKFITWMSNVLGHILFVVFYWICIFIWLGFGPLNDWSDQWQLDINSATSALMVFVFSFLAILRERHADHLRSRLDAVYSLDAELELKLRQITSDDLPNQETVIPAARVSGLQRAINYYADVVGTLVGIALLLAILIIWVALGPVFQFSANWWLFIGTYAGLIGLNDGFVLRNVQNKLREHEQPQYDALQAQDTAMFARLGLTPPPLERPSTQGLFNRISHRVSEKMNLLCGHEYTVVLGVCLILALLTGSSVMMWSETGQLLCNIPPSIIESFFMVILITGHNAADKQRRMDLANMWERRRGLVAFVDEAMGVVKVDVEVEMGKVG